MIKIYLNNEEREAVLRALDDRHGLLSGILPVEAGETKGELQDEIDLIELVTEKITSGEIEQ